jgi:hypothetical protein
MGGTS